MATTRYAKSVVGSLPRTARFSVTADNDVLLSGGDYLVLGVYHHGANTTAVNIDSGADVTTFPIKVVSTEDLCVTASGAGDVSLVFVEMPVAGYTTQEG
jgi:hypothetical protein